MVAIRANIPEDLYELVKRRTGESQEALDEAITTALRQAYAADVRSQASIEDERQRVREALSNLLAPGDWLSGLHKHWGEPLTDDEEAEYYRNMPTLDPPLSQTVIEMREEERY
jgi:hypothetical protein